MKTMFLVAASLLAVSAGAQDDNGKSDRCEKMDIMMGTHKVEPIKPEQHHEAILPKGENERSGPAVLIPNCGDKETKRGKKRDYPLA